MRLNSGQKSFFVADQAVVMVSRRSPQAGREFDLNGRKKKNRQPIEKIAGEFALGPNQGGLNPAIGSGRPTRPITAPCGGGEAVPIHAPARRAKCSCNVYV